MVRYLFRKPKYPVLIETDTRVKGARSGQIIDRLHRQLSFANRNAYIVIDSTGEGWNFVPEHGVISPLIIHKRWNKPKIIEFFNNALDKTGAAKRYEPRSLSNRRLEQVILEIIEFESRL